MKIENFNSIVEIVPPETKKVSDFLDTAFCYLKDFSSFQDYMENVTKISEEQNEEGTFHTWEVLVEDVDLKWKQKTVVDADDRAIRFNLIEGDLEMLEGAWRVEENESMCSLQFHADFCMGLPIIEEVLGPVFREKLKDNCYTMLNNIKEKLERVE